MISQVVKVDHEFIYLYTYNRLYKLNWNGALVRSINLRGIRPYFIANGRFLFGISNNEKRIYIYNLDLEIERQLEYDENYDKVYFNTDEALIILKHARFPAVRIV